MDINKTVFDFNEVINSFDLPKVMVILDELKTLKVELKKDRRDICKSGTQYIYPDILDQIDEQMKYLDMNIQTFDKALLCFESRCFEYIFDEVMDVEGMICLN